MNLLCVACGGTFLADSALPDRVMAPQRSISEHRMYVGYCPTCHTRAHLFNLQGPYGAGSVLSPIVQVSKLRLGKVICPRTFNRGRAGIWTRDPAMASWS